jgi:hypothetical protein
MPELIDVLAGGPGFEPGLHGSEPRVLPLNYPPTHKRCVSRWMHGLVAYAIQACVDDRTQYWHQIVTDVELAQHRLSFTVSV